MSAGSITIVVTSNRRRGAEVFGDRLAAGLTARGWDTDFVALSGASDPPRVAAEPITDHRPEALPRFAVDVIRSLRRRVRQVRPDVLLANGGATLRYSVAAMAGRRGRPLVVYGSIGEPLYWARTATDRSIQRVLLRRVDHVLAVSAATREQLIGRLAVPADRVSVVHTGVPPAFLDLEPHRRETEIHLLFVGNLSREKRPDLAVEAVARLSKLVPARLRILGGGPLEEDVRRLAGQMGVVDRVEVMGSVPDVAPHFAWADALILTSATEGLPGVVIEAAMAATPAVAFDVGGVAETVGDGVTGRVVPAGDVEAMVEALAELAADPDRGVRWGTEARAMARERFSLDRSLERYDAVLTDLLKRRRSAVR